MQRVLVAGAVGTVLLSMGVVRQQELSARLATIELETAGEARRQAARSEAEWASLRTTLEELREETASFGSRDAARAGLMARLDALETQLAGQGSALAGQDENLSDVRRRFEDLERAGFDVDRLRRLEAELVTAVDTTSALAAVASRPRAAAPDSDDLWHATMAPTVQLAGDTSVGSGVLLASQEVEEGTYETLLLTCWHVVRDIQADGRGADAAVPVTVYAQDGAVWRTSADVVAANVELDACVLRLHSEEHLDVGVELPSAERLARAKVFDTVVAAGCPLGNDPIPTLGNLSDLRHRVDGMSFWMISAPTYIGNSGGGIFGGDDHALMGIFSKIYTHGALRPTIVPHMGLVTPLELVMDWLDELPAVEVVVRADGSRVLRTR